MAEIKNQYYMTVYMIKSIIHEVVMLLYRAYLFLLFAMSKGGAIVLGLVAGGMFYALEHMETNFLSLLPEWVTAPVQRFRDSILTSEILEGIYVPSFEYGYEIIAGLIAVGVFLVLRVSSRLIAPVVYAFPMPRRPLPPVLRWIPPEHKIHAVKAAIAAPRRKGVAWDGDLQRIVVRLPERLQAVLNLKGTQEAQKRPALPQSSQDNPLPPVAKVAQPARPKRKPAAQEAGNGAGEDRGRFILPANGA